MKNFNDLRDAGFDVTVQETQYGAFFVQVSRFADGERLLLWSSFDDDFDTEIECRIRDRKLSLIERLNAAEKYIAERSNFLEIKKHADKMMNA